MTAYRLQMTPAAVSSGTPLRGCTLGAAPAPDPGCDGIACATGYGSYAAVEAAVSETSSTPSGDPFDDRERAAVRAALARDAST